MKKANHNLRSPVSWNLLLLLATFTTFYVAQLPTCLAQGTGFTCQGRLNEGGTPANGSYVFRFSVYAAQNNSPPLGAPITLSPVDVTNGLFTVALDFGDGIFTGANRWLGLEVRTNGNAVFFPFVPLTPLQPVLPVPYAIHAAGVDATGIIGVVSNAISSVNATNFSGPLLGEVTGTQVATVVASVNGLPAFDVASGASRANAATPVNAGDTIVKRDGSGNFAARSVTLDGTLNLPATTTTAGIIYSGGSTLLHGFGTENFFAGRNAGNLTTSGIGFNTGIGSGALFANGTGFANTALGYQALVANTEGFYNTASGAGALYANTTGDYNTAHGAGSLYANTAGNNNTASGYQALYANTTGSGNTASGVRALNANLTGGDNTATGFEALLKNTGFGNTASGSGALRSNTVGFLNTATGYKALFSHTSGYANTAVGNQALSANTTGYGNTAVGDVALVNNTNGNGNIAVGFGAGANRATGDNNIDIGNVGVAAESNTLRVGTQGTQTDAFIAGIYGSAAGGGVPVGVNASGKLGTLAGRLDARIAITNTGAVTISAPGSYYLTTNITVSSGNAITIVTNNVTLDLNGFSIFSTAYPATGSGIHIINGFIPGPFSGIELEGELTILNGHIQGGVTNDNTYSVFDGPGFLNGISTLYPSTLLLLNIRVARVSVSRCLNDGINLGQMDDYLYPSRATVVESCTVFRVGGYGIVASVIKDSTATWCGADGIAGLQVSDCIASSLNGSGINADTAQNCRGKSFADDGDSYGLVATIAQHCWGFGQVGGGLSAEMAQGCNGFSANPTSWGLKAIVAIGCRGANESPTGGGLWADIANSCYSVGSWSIGVKYNMP